MAKKFKGRFKKQTARKYDYNIRKVNQAMYKNAQLESTRYGWSARFLAENINITA